LRHIAHLGVGARRFSYTVRGFEPIETPVRVELVGPDGDVFARGIASVDAADLDKRPANVEAVHRDRLVLDS
jgi:hypothetical protein